MAARAGSPKGIPPESLAFRFQTPFISSSRSNQTQENKLLLESLHTSSGSRITGQGRRWIVRLADHTGQSLGQVTKV